MTESAKGSVAGNVRRTGGGRTRVQHATALALFVVLAVVGEFRDCGAVLSIRCETNRRSLDGQGLSDGTSHDRPMPRRWERAAPIFGPTLALSGSQGEGTRPLMDLTGDRRSAHGEVAATVPVDGLVRIEVTPGARRERPLIHSCTRARPRDSDAGRAATLVAMPGVENIRIRDNPNFGLYEVALSHEGHRLKSLRTPPHRALLKILRTRRDALGFSQTEVARRVGRGQSWMSKNEIGERRIDVIEFARLCKVLSLHPGRVLSRLPGL